MYKIIEFLMTFSIVKVSCLYICLCMQGSGLEYTMTVTRLPTFNDVLEEETSQCTLCPEAVQRTLATMLDLSLLTSPTFLLLCLSGFTTMMGFFIPFMYLEGKCFAERTQFGWQLGSKVCIESCSRDVNNYFKSKQLSFHCFFGSS